MCEKRSKSVFDKATGSSATYPNQILQATPHKKSTRRAASARIAAVAFGFPRLDSGPDNYSLMKSMSQQFYQILLIRQALPRKIEEVRRYHC